MNEESKLLWDNVIVPATCARCGIHYPIAAFEKQLRTMYQLSDTEIEQLTSKYLQLILIPAHDKGKCPHHAESARP
jgi:hypothetical protein